MELNMSAPCLFGIEGICKNELRRLGLNNVQAENGRVRFTGTEDDLARSNVMSHFAERILVDVGTGLVKTFDECFELVKAMPWENYIPKGGAFPVTGYSLTSQLHSVPDLQKIIKKAISVRLGKRYGVGWLPENGDMYQVRFSLLNDRLTVSLDSSGVGLHKRGYRPAQVSAPLRETLAAALVDIAGYRGKGEFLDPFCGSGTIAIEAALAAKGRAPGINRDFAAEKWAFVGRERFRKAVEEARGREYSGSYTISASDIDPKAIELARANARRAGVEDIIRFSVADAREFSRSTEAGVIVTNPPYGERMMEVSEAQRLMADFGRAYRKTRGWELYIISSDPELEHSCGLKSEKTRKLYNGMIKCGYYKLTVKKGQK